MTHTFGPYSPIRQAGTLYFVSGQVGIDAYRQAANDVASQTHQALANMRDALESAGLFMGNVVKTTIFLKNIDDFTVVNEVYVSYFPELRPARSCVGIASLPKLADNELLIEIEAIAYKESA
jgi:2-iminobutanoate/2-iminopropanoate deaminase